MATSRVLTPEALARLRHRLHLTQAQLAGLLGVTRNTVARWEIGLRRIPEPAARLAQRLLKERRSKKRE
jgi:transcriptional regulator with XRE-family HTH domain